jgi:hypothetical protein
MAREKEARARSVSNPEGAEVARNEKVKIGRWGMEDQKGRIRSLVLPGHTLSGPCPSEMIVSWDISSLRPV